MPNILKMAMDAVERAEAMGDEQGCATACSRVRLLAAVQDPSNQPSWDAAFAVYSVLVEFADDPAELYVGSVYGTPLLWRHVVHLHRACGHSPCDARRYQTALARPDVVRITALAVAEPATSSSVPEGIAGSEPPFPSASARAAHNAGKRDAALLPHLMAEVAELRVSLPTRTAAQVGVLHAEKYLVYSLGCELNGALPAATLLSRTQAASLLLRLGLTDAVVPQAADLCATLTASEEATQVSRALAAELRSVSVGADTTLLGRSNALSHVSMRARALVDAIEPEYGDGCPDSTSHPLPPIACLHCLWSDPSAREPRHPLCVCAAIVDGFNESAQLRRVRESTSP